MVRHGVKRVRTGCLTCKIRKVKCDETRPNCSRCVATGRKCDGYPVLSRSPSPPPVDVAPSHPLLPDFGGSSNTRAFDFFVTTVAPMLAGHFDESIWTHLITQISWSEPSVRHAALALGSAIENRANAPTNVDALTLQHSNQAIRALIAVTDETLILATCILFICQEWLRGQVRRAIAHFYQGLRILENITQPTPVVKDVLAPVFCRLCLFPILFGHAPRVQIQESYMRAWTSIPARFDSVTAALHSFSALWVLMLACLREAEGVRFSKMPTSTLSEAWHSQYGVVNDLMSRWSTAYTGLLLTGADTGKFPLRVLWCQYLIARVWLDVALATTQLAFDEHEPKFESIIEHAVFIVENSGIQKPGAFIFDIGIIPILYFTGAKSRCAETRLGALDLLKRMGEQGVRENLWHAQAIHDVLEKVIEHEHDCSVAELKNKLQLQESVELPTAERRVEDYHRMDLSLAPEQSSVADVPVGATVLVSLRDQTGWHIQSGYVIH